MSFRITEIRELTEEEENAPRVPTITIECASLGDLRWTALKLAHAFRLGDLPQPQRYSAGLVPEYEL